MRAARLVAYGNEANGYGTDTERYGVGDGTVWRSSRPSGSFRRWEMTSLRARDGRIVGSCRDITGPYPYILGKMYGVYWTGLGDRAIESLRRIHL